MGGYVWRHVHIKQRSAPLLGQRMLGRLSAGVCQRCLCVMCYVRFEAAPAGTHNHCASVGLFSLLVRCSLSCWSLTLVRLRLSALPWLISVMQAPYNVEMRSTKVCRASCAFCLAVSGGGGSSPSGGGGAGLFMSSAVATRVGARGATLRRAHLRTHLRTASHQRVAREAGKDQGSMAAGCKVIDPELIQRIEDPRARHVHSSVPMRNL